MFSGHCLAQSGAQPWWLLQALLSGLSLSWLSSDLSPGSWKCLFASSSSSVPPPPLLPSSRPRRKREGWGRERPEGVKDRQWGVGRTTQGDPAGEPSGGRDQGGQGGGWIKAGWGRRSRVGEKKPELLSSQSDGDVGKKTPMTSETEDDPKVAS